MILATFRGGAPLAIYRGSLATLRANAEAATLRGEAWRVLDGVYDTFDLLPPFDTLAEYPESIFDPPEPPALPPT